jgi:arsenate reductase
MTKNLLFLCTGNACRSQMAEGLARRVLPPGMGIFSAGTHPTTVDPRAIEVMRELDIDISAQRSKSIAEIPLDAVAHVVTLCDDAQERCRVALGASREHWPLPDPARAQGSHADVLQTFRAVRDEILRRVQALGVYLGVEIASGEP